jgi:formylmethanofuran dehydrogenase subunit E
MKMKNVHVGINNKVNLGNNETKIFTISIDAEVDDGEDVYDVTNELKNRINFQLREWETEYKEKKGLKVNENKIKGPKTSITPKEKIDILEEVICPKCGDIMSKEDGKNYYMCEEHYGSMQQINKGKVMKRKF